MREIFGKLALKGPPGKVARNYLGREFSARDNRKCLIYYVPSRISFSQVYPFYFYAREILDWYGPEIRLAPVDTILAGEARRADIVLLQTWLDVPGGDLVRALETIAKTNPEAKISFLDSFANNDLRLAKYVDPYISFYVKKSLFKDREHYFSPYRGDTNLTEYYGELFGLKSDPVDWEVPRSILGKLRLGPNFFTSPNLISLFNKSGLEAWSDARPIDVHARMETKGSEWYSNMRRASVGALNGHSNANIVKVGNVSGQQFMAELRKSKVCWSPFGYGELCWRDIEAFATGSALVKPDMGHLETAPNLYFPGDTYTPVRWDFSDLSERVSSLIHDEDARQRMANCSFAIIKEYLDTAQFVYDMRFLFAD